MYQYSKKRSLKFSIELMHSQKSSTGKLGGQMLVDGTHDTCIRLSTKQHVSTMGSIQKHTFTSTTK